MNHSFYWLRRVAEALSGQNLSSVVLLTMSLTLLKSFIAIPTYPFSLFVLSLKAWVESCEPLGPKKTVLGYPKSQIVVTSLGIKSKSRHCLRVILAFVKLIQKFYSTQLSFPKNILHEFFFLIPLVIFDWIVWCLMSYYMRIGADFFTFCLFVCQSMVVMYRKSCEASFCL